MKTGKIMVLALTLAVLALAATGCKKGGATPTGITQAYFEAVKNKDVAGMKNVFSKRSLQLLEERARQLGRPLDELMKEQTVPPFEAQNEKINGDTATLEVKDENGKWETYNFIKEDGVWKVALGGVAGETGGGAQGGGDGGMQGGGTQGGTQGGGEHGGH
jgi:Domain of unknown function (DUF4878)